MQSIRSVLFTAAALTITFAAFVLTASLALAGIAAVVVVGSAIATRLNFRPARATARPAAAGAAQGQREMRIWNDGRGTIIDL